MEKGKLTISRVTSNQKEDYIKIQLQDEHHRVVVVGEISLKEFAKSITGMGCCYCEYKEFISKRNGELEGLGDD